LQISTTSIRRPVSVAMLFIGIAFLSMFAFTQLGIDLLPNINIPHLLVQTTFPNATPEEVEKQIINSLPKSLQRRDFQNLIFSSEEESQFLNKVHCFFVWEMDMK